MVQGELVGVVEGGEGDERGLPLGGGAYILAVAGLLEAEGGLEEDEGLIVPMPGASVMTC